MFGSQPRTLMQRIEAEITRAKREGEAFSLLALDLDNFKAVNDHYGHQVGDEVLQGFVRRCFDAIRPYDGVARVGGEEFMVLLPRSARELAFSIGERLRTAVESPLFESSVGRKVPMTVSIGVAVSHGFIALTT